MANFIYKAEEFTINVEDIDYKINIAKVGLILQMGDILEGKTEKALFTKEFMDEVYKILIDLLGEESFDGIFSNHKYDILFLLEFISYLNNESAPHLERIGDRASQIATKYSKESLNEPTDSQTTEV